MNSIVITGCNRGLGLGLTRALLRLPKPPKHLITTCRNRLQAKELQELADQHDNVHILELDLKDFDCYDNFVQQIDNITEGQGLNVLFNNAGIAPKSARINFVRKHDLLNTYETNTMAPIMLAKACLPLLKKASSLQSDDVDEFSIQRAAILNMSSIMGSIASNCEGGVYAYRASKAALNAATKSLSIDLHHCKILCVALHPGWVRTNMGGQKAPIDIETSATKLLETILNLNATHNGGFYQYDGTMLSW